MKRHLIPLLLPATLLTSAAAQPVLPGNVPVRKGFTLVDDDAPYVPNTFIGSFRMEMRSYGKDDVQDSGPITMRYWSTADRTLTETGFPGSPPMRTLTDHKGKWQYMLMGDATDGRMAMRVRKKVVVPDGPGKGDAPQLEVTNETKDIDGHRCVKMAVRSEEGTWTGWMAQDLPSPAGDLQRMMATGDPRLMQRMAHAQGFPLEFEWTVARDGHRMRCTFHDVATGHIDEGLFSLDGYQVIEMPGR